MAKLTADMDVLATQEGIETPAEKPKRKPKAPKVEAHTTPDPDPIPPVDPPTTPDPDPIPPVDPPTPPVVPSEPIRMDIAYTAMDAIMAEVKLGKSVGEAVLVDTRIADAFAAHPYLIVRESRNSYFYSLKLGEVPRAACAYSGIWAQPVSYAISE